MKLQSFFIMKFSSSRLKYENYRIKIKLSEARENNEIIRVGNSPLISELNRIRKVTSENLNEVSVAEIDIKKLRKKRNSEVNKSKIEKLNYLIDKYLFIDDIIYVHFDNIKHYNSLMKKKLFINNKEYVRLISSAGNARQQNVIFIKKELYEKIDNFIENGRDENYKIGKSKYNAYAGLVSSAGHKVEFPKIVVIKDYKTTRKTRVDFVTTEKEEEPFVEERFVELEFVPFDGMGICSINYMNKIAYELDLDFVPSWFVFRSAWLKGMVCSFDFKEFSKIKKISKIKDIYGDEHNIEDIDIILTESQFKLSGAYRNFQHYVSEIKSRDYGFWITRTSPKKEKRIATTNYQYLQCLDMNEEDVLKICEPTIQYFKDVSGLSWEKTILFLIGSLSKEDINLRWWNSLDPLVRLLFTNPEFISDGFVRNKLKKMISKKIKESYIGTLRIFGNYQVMISDVLAFTEHALGLEVKGLLKEKEVFSSFWNKENSKKISALRSPMTYRSEINVLNVKNNKETQKWFGHLTGIIYNVFDDSDLLHAGSDRDGDLVMTTNNEIFINKTFGGLPAVYDRKSAEKVIINKDELWESDKQVFKNHIGFITNLSTTLYSMLPLFDKEDIRHSMIINRLKNATCQQSREIDKGKGILVEDIPDWWTKHTKIDENWNDELKRKIAIRNDISVNKRPLFFKWLYDDYNKEYKKYLFNYNTYCLSNFGITLEQLLSKKDKSEEESKTEFYYKKYSKLIDSPSVMNMVCKTMEKEVRPLKDQKNNVLYNFTGDKEKMLKMKELYSDWKILRKRYNREDGEILSSEIRRRADSISIKSREIAMLAMNVSVGFALTVFPMYVEELYFVDKIQVPVLDDNGNIEFSKELFSLMEFEVADD